MNETITLEWVTFNNTTFVDSGLFDIIDIFDKEDKDYKDPEKFDEKRSIYELWWQYYVVLYEDEEIYNKDKFFFKKYYKKDVVLGDYQIPEYCWDFEHDWKKCIIIDARNQKIDNNLFNRFVYEWVIINSDFEEHVKKYKWDINDII